MRQGGKKYSDMGHSLFLNSTCDIEENKRQGHATLPFLKFDIRHWGPPIKGPSETIDPQPPKHTTQEGLTFCWCLCQPSPPDRFLFNLFSHYQLLAFPDFFQRTTFVLLAFSGGLNVCVCVCFFWEIGFSLGSPVHAYLEGVSGIKGLICSQLHLDRSLLAFCGWPFLWSLN